MNTTERKPVDVLAAMGGLRDLARHRLTMKRRDFDRMAAAGKEPNVLESIKAERAEYLVQQADDARAAVAELIEDRARLDFLIEHQYIVRKLSDTGLWMLLNRNGNPITDGKHETAREAIDEWRYARAAVLARVQGGAG